MDNLFFVAKICLNHNGNLNLAKKTVDPAKYCGADAVKFQSVKGGKLVSPKLSIERVDGFGMKDIKTVGEFWERVSIDKNFGY